MKTNLAPGRDQSATVIAEAVLIFLHLKRWLNPNFIGLAQIRFARGMNLEQGYDGNFPDSFKLNIVTKANQHRYRALHYNHLQARLRCGSLTCGWPASRHSFLADAHQLT